MKESGNINKNDNNFHENFKQKKKNIIVIWKFGIYKNFELCDRYISPNVDDFLGLPEGTINNNRNKFLSYIKPEYLPELNAALKKAISSIGKIYNIEYPIIKADGEIINCYSIFNSQKEHGDFFLIGTTSLVDN